MSNSLATTVLGEAAHSQADRRDTYRLPLLYGAAWLGTEDGRRIPFRNLSGGGGAIQLAQQWARRWDGYGHVVYLGDKLTFSTRIRLFPHYGAPTASPRCGLSFQGLSYTGQRFLSRFLVDEAQAQRDNFARFLLADGAVRVEEPAAIRRLLRLYTVAACQTVRVFDAKGPRDLRLSVTKVGDFGIDAMELGQQATSLVHGQMYGFVAAGESSVLAFRARVCRLGPKEVRLFLPQVVVQSGFRKSVRCTPPRDEVLTVRVSHHALDRQSRRVGEFSAEGLSFTIDLDREPLCPGARTRCLQVFRGSRQIASAEAVVRSIVPWANGRQARCGIELVDFSSRSERANWQRLVFESLYPRLESGPRATAGAAWQVLRGSAYVDDWAHADAHWVERAFLRAWGPRRGGTGRLLTLSDSKGAVATTAGTWVYPRTWMFHHFGVDRRLRLGQRSFATYAREIYAGSLHEYRHGSELDFFMMYLERGAGWNERIYDQFVARHDDPAQLRYLSNEVFRCATAHASTEYASQGVRPATAADRALLAQRLLATRSQLELDALSLDAANLEPGCLHEKFREQGFERDRRIYIGCLEGEPQCALVCETGDEGVNVFGLLNTCWVEPLGPHSADARVRRALYARAVQHYRENGKRWFVLFEPGGSRAPEAVGLGYRYVSPGMHWLASRDVMPAWFAHVRDVLAAAAGMMRPAKQRKTSC